MARMESLYHGFNRIHDKCESSHRHGRIMQGRNLGEVNIKNEIRITDTTTTTKAIATTKARDMTARNLEGYYV